MAKNLTEEEKKKITEENQKIWEEPAIPSAWDILDRAIILLSDVEYSVNQCRDWGDFKRSLPPFITTAAFIVDDAEYHLKVPFKYSYWKEVKAICQLILKYLCDRRESGPKTEDWETEIKEAINLITKHLDIHRVTAWDEFEPRKIYKSLCKQNKIKSNEGNEPDKAFVFHYLISENLKKLCKSPDDLNSQSSDRWIELLTTVNEDKNPTTWYHGETGILPNIKMRTKFRQEYPYKGEKEVKRIDRFIKEKERQLNSSHTPRDQFDLILSEISDLKKEKNNILGKNVKSCDGDEEFLITYGSYLEDLVRLPEMQNLLRSYTVEKIEAKVKGYKESNRPKRNKTARNTSKKEAQEIFNMIQSLLVDISKSSA